MKVTLVLINTDGSYQNDVSRSDAATATGKSQYKLDKLIKVVTKDERDEMFTFAFENGVKLMVIAYRAEDIDIIPSQAADVA